MQYTEEDIEMLKQNKINVSDELKRYIGKDTELTEYDLYEFLDAYEIIGAMAVVSIEDIELVSKYVDSDAFQVKINNKEEYERALQLLGNNGKNLIINKDVAKLISSGEIDAQGNSTFCLALDNVTDMTPEELAEISSDLGISDIAMTPNKDEVYDMYSVDDHKEMYARIQNIIGQIDPNMPEASKAYKVYEFLASEIEYAYDENGEIDIGTDNAQGLRGALINNRCVCAGYAKALQQVLKSIGIECKYLSGETLVEGHAWNQIKIDDKWYNVDLTYDSNNIRETGSIENFLLSDDDFSYHQPRSSDYEKCPESFDMSKVEQEVQQSNGYSREENGTNYLENWQQVLKDYSGKQIGHRTITEHTDISNGTRRIETDGIIEDEDEKYTMQETTSGVGDELQFQRKEMIWQDKKTGKKQQTVFQRDSQGNEMYYKTINGQIAFKITKTPRGIVIDNYDNGQLVDTYEYDKDGKAINGMADIEELDENYLENCFDTQVPYFEAENREIESQNRDGQNLLDSAIEATEETTRTSTINEQVQNIRNIQRDKTQQQDKANNGIDR